VKKPNKQASSALIALTAELESLFKDFIHASGGLTGDITITVSGTRKKVQNISFRGHAGDLDFGASTGDARSTGDLIEIAHGLLTPEAKKQARVREAAHYTKLSEAAARQAAIWNAESEKNNTIAAEILSRRPLAEGGAL
jgi:hypothetical protein